MGLAVGGRPDLHGQLMGWALDGFGIYSYQVNHEDDYLDYLDDDDDGDNGTFIVGYWWVGTSG